MAKKPSAKRAFDWRTYSKPARALSPAQEEAFATGVLAPVLAWALADPRSRFEIRARAAGLYHRGIAIARITAEEPFIAEFEPAEGSPPERVTLGTAEDVAALVARLDEKRAAIDAAIESGEASRARRSFTGAIAAGNAGGDLFSDEIVVIDTDYRLAKRKLDLVALVRTEGVTGPGGFSNALLAFIDLRTPEQSLGGQNSLAAVASDVAEYVKAISGEHLTRTAEEMTQLVAQKIRLGLLPAEMEIRGVDPDLPQIMVAFAESDPTDPSCDAAIIELHEKLTARHYPTALLRFAHFTAVPEDGDGIALEPGDAMTYREFKAYRTAGR